MWFLREALDYNSNLSVTYCQLFVVNNNLLECTNLLNKNMENCGHLIDFERLYGDISELRECKQEIAVLKEYRSGSESKFQEIKENVTKLFERIEGGVDKGLRGEIAEIRGLLGKFEENITEVYERIEKIEELLEKTIREVYELTPMVKALMDIEQERKDEKKSFRVEFRIWLIGFIATALVTAGVTWYTVSAGNKSDQQQVKDIVNQVMLIQHQKDSVAAIKK